MKRYRIFAAIIGVCLCLSRVAIAGEPAKSERVERRVSVEGHGKVSAVPDQARLWVQVSEEGNRLDAVNQEARHKMEAVLRVLKAQGIAEKDIQTQAYQVAPKMEWRNGRLNRVGYTVSNQVAVTVHDVKKAGAVLAAVLDAGANNVNGPQFEFEHPHELERKALELAVQDAKAKAAVMAQSAGASLGEVVTIQEGTVYHPGPRPLMMKAAAPGMAQAAAEEPIAVGEETVQTTVSATFALK